MAFPINKQGGNSQQKRHSQQLIASSPEETFAVGKELSARLSPGDVIALSGTLGSGKTQLTKGIASGLGITENLTSPTYTIVNEYFFTINNDQFSAGKENTFYHIDVYRLENEKDFEDIGGDEILNSNGICVIEWSERISNLLPPDCIKISIKITGDSLREILITRIESCK